MFDCIPIWAKSPLLQVNIPQLGIPWACDRPTSQRSDLGCKNQTAAPDEIHGPAGFRHSQNCVDGLSLIPISIQYIYIQYVYSVYIYTYSIQYIYIHNIVYSIYIYTPILCPAVPLFPNFDHDPWPIPSPELGGQTVIVRQGRIRTGRQQATRTAQASSEPGHAVPQIYPW